ncbi:MAG: sigma 54-interacting transcriptional regulator [Candidatus Alcyoniella australis]|nr:sigma 54-interacting transcriptional regulator [Candidatus Alcyoniella australis]
MGTQIEPPEIIAKSKPMSNLIKLVHKVAPYKSTVLVQGESGTGKELMAQLVHKLSPRKDNPFVVVDCGAIPPNLLEAELFGHVKGAFTGAVRSETGLFERGNGGTVFMDEIGELPLDLQVKLLRVIQEEVIHRVGERLPIKLDIRMIAATNRNLDQMVEEGKFRQDLYYRLNVVMLSIPPLRERDDDISPMAVYFVNKFSEKLNKPIAGITREALGMLRNYDWPGNVRELENAIEQTVVMLDEGTHITPENLPLFLEKRGAERRNRFRREALDKKLSIEEYTKCFIESYQDDHTEKALAKFLGITPKTLWKKRKRWGLKRSLA